MTKQLFSLVIAAFVFVSFTQVSWAGPASNPVVNPEPTPTANSAPTASPLEPVATAPQAEKKERPKLYFTASIGYAGIDYGSNPTASIFAASEDSSTTTHLPFATDTAAMIQVLGPQNAVGIGYDGIFDSYSTNSTSNSGSIQQSCIVGTFRHFFGDVAGRGLYLRGDFGLAIVTLTTSSPNGTWGWDTTSSTTTYLGPYVLGGAGYNLFLATHVSLSFEGSYGRAFLSTGSIGEWEPKFGVMITI